MQTKSKQMINAAHEGDEAAQKLWGGLYDLGVNIYNNTVRNVGFSWTGGLGLSQDATSALSTGLMALGTYGGETSELLKSGNSQERSMRLGGWMAAAEYVGEKVEVDHWFSNISGRNAGALGQTLLTALKQGVTEAPGEMLTETLQILANNYFTEENCSEAENTVNELVFVYGMDRAEAEQYVMESQLTQILYAGAMGMASGTVTNAFSITAGSVRDYALQRHADKLAAQNAAGQATDTEGRAVSGQAMTDNEGRAVSSSSATWEEVLNSAQYTENSAQNGETSSASLRLAPSPEGKAAQYTENSAQSNEEDATLRALAEEVRAEQEAELASFRQENEKRQAALQQDESGKPLQPVKEATVRKGTAEENTNQSEQIQDNNNQSEQIQDNNNQSEQIQKNTTPSQQADRLYSLRNVAHDAKTIHQNKQNVRQMEAAAVIRSAKFNMSEARLVERVKEYYDGLGQKVTTEALGDVLLSKKGIKSAFAHGMTQLKAALYEAVPDVLQKGKLIDYQDLWKGRNYDTAIIAAPVSITEGDLQGDYYAGVIVNLYQNGDNRYYTHDGVAAIVKKNEGTVLTTMNDNEHSRSSTLRSLQSILKELANVNDGEQNGSLAAETRENDTQASPVAQTSETIYGTASGESIADENQAVNSSSLTQDETRIAAFTDRIQDMA